MGIIRKQSIKGATVSFFGAALGFLSSVVIQPLLLSSAQIGLLRLLITYSGVIAQVFGFGITPMTLRLFPEFRDAKAKHNGFLFISLSLTTIGFLLAGLVCYFGYDILITFLGTESKLLVKYMPLLIPLVLFTMYYNHLDAYLTSLFNAIKGTLYKEIIQRLMILSFLVLFWLEIINIDLFIVGYVISICAPAIFIAIVLIRNKEFHLKPDFSFIKKPLFQEMVNVGSYGLLIGLGFIIVREIDFIMINLMLDESNVGVYSVLFNFAILVAVPSRVMKKISASIIAQSWKENDIDNVKKVYYESCLNMLIVGSILTIGLISNIGNVLTFLDVEYHVENVVIFLAIGNWFFMATGVNNEVIANSKHYRVNAIFVFVLIVLLIVGNLIFIPKMGIEGAALATMLAIFITNILRFIFLYQKFGFQPMNKNTLMTLLISGFTFAIAHYLPQLPHPLLDFLYRGTITVFVFSFLIVKLNVSAQINEFLVLAIAKVKNRKRT